MPKQRRQRGSSISARPATTRGRGRGAPTRASSSITASTRSAPTRGRGAPTRTSTRASPPSLPTAQPPATVQLSGPQPAAAVQMPGSGPVELLPSLSLDQFLQLVRSEVRSELQANYSTPLPTQTSLNSPLIPPVTPFPQLPTTQGLALCVCVCVCGGGGGGGVLSFYYHHMG